MYERLVHAFEAAGRPDLACQARLKWAEYPFEQKQWLPAAKGLSQTINKFPDEGRYVPQMMTKLQEACGQFKGGSVSYENISTVVTGDMFFVTDIETYSGQRMAGVEGVTGWSNRVTHIFRRENGEWRLVHRRSCRRPCRIATWNSEPVPKGLISVHGSQGMTSVT